MNLIVRKEYFIDKNYQPKVSIIMSVFNEEKVIERTILNFLNSDYDLDKIEFVIGSDNSNDSTNAILDKLQKQIPTLKFFAFNNRRGKAHVLNDLFQQASSEILIFSDANTIYNKLAIKNLVKYYNDQSVGGVSGKLILLDYNESIQSGSQERSYWNFETWLKEKEGQLGKLIGANGGIYSLRKDYFVRIPTDFPIVDDFYLSLKVLEQKRDFLYIKDATAEELTAPSLISEFRRKIRGNANILSTVKTLKKLLIPSFGLISYSLWSHKVIRWFTPIILLSLLLVNFLLYPKGVFYQNFFLIQLFFYLCGLVGYFLNKLHIRIKPLLLIFYFLLTNVAMLLGIIQFLLNKNTAFWQSTPR